MLIANLLDNALRYTPEGGRIDVAVDDDAGQAVLSVVDTGPGIPAGERERVFERFHRGASAGRADARPEAASGCRSSGASPTRMVRPSTLGRRRDGRGLVGARPLSHGA